MGDGFLEGEDLMDQSTQDPRMIAVTKWRLQYRRFRMGHAHGSEGELAAVSAGLALGFLPVVQLLRLRRSRAPSPATAAVEDTSFHVHFGSGKLGLGLVLKCLTASPKPFILLQHARGHWMDLIGDTDLPVIPIHVEFASGERPIVLGLIREEFHTEERMRQLLRFGEMQGWIILTNSPLTRRVVLEQATTLSTSVGTTALSAVGDILLASLSNRTDKLPVLFACENDHNAVAKLAQQMGSKIRIVPCMVDRICSSLKSQRDASGKRMVLVETETYSGDLVVLQSFDGRLPFGGKEVKCPSLEIQAHYFADRKFLLVNGGHTTLAFLTMIRLHDGDKNFVPPGADPLLDWNTCNMNERLLFWSFTVARLLLLLWQYDVEVLKDAHQVATDDELADALLDYAKQTLARFSAIPDTTDRILGGGVDNRFHGRLRNLEDFIDLQFDGLNNSSRKLLEKCNCRLTSLIAHIHALVSKAEQFTQTSVAQVEITLPSLV
eukprot:Gregarina_sp_Poly_1__4898@NODE_25_length_19863_cov_179_262730_g23_i0_p4_GENE_NODE_25_length_19863_cov_179_262730_g23_i0NODE_25_length_19863_cov_179_262730_g23_i0_p4_ORF_typecomplete_len566_score70_62Mannitol_dh_C/PF08125_13/0_00064Mannitol_dh_C/PF08125_13/45Peptidase_M18/PF02127_15/0_043_NODE_25_length_19863_cov_179_262730_g23_i02211699